jgi:hypothetical protein
VLEFRKTAQFAVRLRVDALCRVATLGSDREIGLHWDVGWCRRHLTERFGLALVPSARQVAV